MKGTIYFLQHGREKPEIIEYDDVRSEEHFINMMAMALIIGDKDGAFTDKAFGYFEGTWYHSVPSCNDPEQIQAPTDANNQEIVDSDSRFQLTPFAVVGMGFNSVREVRDKICNRNERYDSCTVCPHWTYKDKCTLLREKRKVD